LLHFVWQLMRVSSIPFRLEIFSLIAVRELMGKTAYISSGITDFRRLDTCLHNDFIIWIESQEFNFTDFLFSDSSFSFIIRNEYIRLASIDAQIVGYAFSCMMYDSYLSKIGNPAYVSGYSMGVFSALYAAESISLVSGLSLILQLNKLISNSDFQNEDKFSMATIIGLDKKTLKSFAKKINNIEIVNQNGDTNFIVSGEKSALRSLEKELSDNSSILFFKTLQIDIPFHSKLLSRFKKEWASILRHHEIHPPNISVISATTLEILTTKDSLIYELERNFYSPFSWLGVLKKMHKLGVKDLYQCGANKELYKIGKYSGVSHNYHWINQK